MLETIKGVDLNEQILQTALEETGALLDKLDNIFKYTE